MDDRVDRSSAGASAGSGDGTRESDPQLVLLRELVEEHVMIAGEVIELGADAWAIHGSIPGDGDVIVGEFDSEERARIVLDELSAAEDRTDR